MSIHLSDVNFRAALAPPPPPPPADTLDDFYVSFAVAWSQEAHDEWAVSNFGSELLEVMSSFDPDDPFTGDEYAQGIYTATDDPEVTVPAGTLYGEAQHNRLATINKATGAATYGTANGGATFGGALDIRSDGVAYLLNNSNLYILDLTDQSLPVLVSTSVPCNAMSFNDAGVLYGVDSSGGAARALMTVDLVTGAKTVIGSMLNDVDALAWDNDTDVLYAAKGSNATTSNLYTVNPATGGMTSVGAIGYALTGLAVDPTTGTLYGVTSNNSASNPREVITINTVTGAGTLVGALGGAHTPVTDITFSPSDVITGGLGLYTDFGDEGIIGVPLHPEQWYTVDLHVQSDDDHELRLDGEVVALPNSLGGEDLTRWLVLGNLFDGTVAEGFLYFDDFRVGTTAYGSSDLFSDDFEGTLDGWEAVKGTPTLVADPYDSRGQVLRFATDEAPGPWGPFVAWRAG